MLKLLSNPTLAIPTFGSATNGSSQKPGHAYTVAAQCNVTVNTAAASHFTANSSTSQFTDTAHGLVVGEVVQVSNSGGALPSGLSASTNYYVIFIDVNTFQLATSLANALAGTNLTISTNGTGTQTVTATALAGASVQLQKSNDNVNWVNEGSSVSITATGSYFVEKTISTAIYYRNAYAITSGSMSVSEVWSAFGDVN